MALLLSPAGSFDALRAAIDGGADEVYLGGMQFNARAGAKNFDQKQLISAGNLCREHYVHLLITLNTLIEDKAEHTGVYVGTDGLVLGKGKFKVDTSGNVTASGKMSASSLNITGGSISLGGGVFSVNSRGEMNASSGTFTGTVYAGKIESGGDAGKLDGGALVDGSVGVGQCSSGINSSLDYANFANKVFNGIDNTTAKYGRFTSLYQGTEEAGALYLRGEAANWFNITIDGTRYRFLKSAVNPTV